MYFFLAFMMVFAGLFLAGACAMLPLEILATVPVEFRSLLFMMGFVLSFVGLFLLYLRCVKLGVHHIIAPGRPEQILWIFVYKDGTFHITPSMRVVEGQLYSKELDAQISEFRSYRWGDHSIRVVPEGTGSSIDLDLCLYAYVLKTKYGFSNILQARSGWFGKLKKTEPIVGEEKVITGKGLNELPRNPRPK